MTRLNIFIFLIIPFFIACNRLNKENKQLLEDGGSIVKEKSKELLDTAFAKINRKRKSYFPNLPDSSNRKEVFQFYFKFAAPTEIQQDSFYIYEDLMGIDNSVQLSFKSTEKTCNRIQDSLHLTLLNDEGNVNYGFRDDLDWWNTKLLKTIKPYWSGNEGPIYQYLWFDKKTHRIYYLQYDL